MKTYHVDGGARVEPPDYKFHDAYITIVSEKGKLVHHAKIGDVWSGIAEYEAIRWVINHYKRRPLRITSDCTTAIAWAKKGGTFKNSSVSPLDLSGVVLEWEHNNLADQYNAKYISPKKSSYDYYKRWVASGRPQKNNKRPKFVAYTFLNKDFK